MASSEAIPDVVVDIDAPGPPISIQDSGEGGEGGKLKMIVALVKKSLGVKDIAAMRLSLPASLLEPIPNLEYWHYLDRPDLFAAINDSEDPFERMLAVLRFAFTKDLKFIHGKICKPYNSVLGEHFRSHWDVVPAQAHPDPAQPPILRLNTSPEATAAASASHTNLSPGGAGETASIRSGISVSSAGTASKRNSSAKSPSTAATSLDAELAPEMSSLSLAQGAERVRVVYMTEQVSHHPPVSAYHACCPSRGLTLAGIDQISAKVSGTTLRVSPGAHNKGIYVRIEDTGDNREGVRGAGEEYHITHPIASVNGILRGSFYLTVGDSTIVTCTGSKGDEWLRAVVEYKEESWLGRAQYRMDGVVHTYKKGDTEHEGWTRVKDVPKSRVIAEFDGCWRNRIRWRKVGQSPAFTSATSVNGTPTETSQSSVKSGRSSKSSSSGSVFEPTEYTTLLDLSTVYPIPKTVRSLDKQLPNESRKLWSDVTDRLVKKEFGEATKAKLTIEQKQRDEAAERKRTGAEFTPRYFEEDIASGVPTLTEEGRKAIADELAEPSSFCLETHPGDVAPSES